MTQSECRRTLSAKLPGLRVRGRFTTSPWNRSMKEKELRLALVCYGGVSLVLYMHGVIKEMLKLSRASKAYHSVPQSEQREHQNYEAANGDDGRPHDTEDVYFTLLRSIGQTLSLRGIVDSIAGPSAGRLNALFLARALPPHPSFAPLPPLVLYV